MAAGAAIAEDKSVNSYDEQYGVEEDLFGKPYPEFEAFVLEHRQVRGTALDLGCGQGRDALMLAKHGFAVTGVDSSEVGIKQMVERAEKAELNVTGVVADIYAYKPDTTFDTIVLDSILHFGKVEKANELALLDKLVDYLNKDGFFFIFVHKSAAKEKELKKWLGRFESTFEIACEDYIDYTYEESTTDFKSSFQYFMLVLKKF